MMDIPYWIVFSLQKEKIFCNECSKIFVPNDIKAIGIRDSYQNKQKESLFVELFCTKCRSMTLYEIKNMKLVDFALDVLDKKNIPHGLQSVKEMNFKVPGSLNKLEIQKVSYKSKSKITLKELKEHIKFLNEIKIHEEFLVALGMSPEQIKEYEYKKEKKTND